MKEQKLGLANSAQYRPADHLFYPVFQKGRDRREVEKKSKEGKWRERANKIWSADDLVVVKKYVKMNNSQNNYSILSHKTPH